MDFQSVELLIKGINNTLEVVREQSIQTLVNELKATENRKVAFDYEEDLDIPCVSYDGGNHPEYAAYPFADVKSVYLKDDDDKNVYLELDDDFEYGIYRLWSVFELFYVARAVYYKLHPYENKEEE